MENKPSNDSYTPLGSVEELVTDTTVRPDTPATTRSFAPIRIVSERLKKRMLLLGVLPSLLALALVLSFIGLRVFRGGDDTPVDPLLTVETVSPDLSGFELKVEKVTKAEQLIVNGTIVANEGFVLTAGPQPVEPSPGQLYYDQNTKSLRFYSGTQFSNIPLLGDNAIICLVGNDCGFATPSAVNGIATSITTLQAQVSQLGTNNGNVVTTPAAGFQDGGNPTSSTATLGTTTNTGLNLVTNGLARLAINSIGDISADGDTLFVDSQNNRIGVGTNAPSAKLTVYGDTLLNGTTTVGNLLSVDVGNSLTGLVTKNIYLNTSNNTVYNDSQKSVANAPDGTPRYVFNNPSTWREIIYLRCQDTLCNSTVSTVVATNAAEISAPLIKIGPDGMARILYVTWGNPTELHFIRCLDNDCINKSDQTIATTSQYDFYDIGFDLNANGEARVVFYDYDADALMYLYCINDTCSQNGGATLIQSPSFESIISMSLDSSGNAGVAIFNNSNLNYIHCSDSICSSITSETPILGLFNSNYYLDSDIGADNLAKIVYYDDVAQEMSLVTCTNISCSSFIKTVLGTNEKINLSDDIQFSLVARSDNTAAIVFVKAYYDSGGVEYLSCNDPLCNSHTRKTVSNTGGYPVNISVNTDNLATVAFWDAKNLKLVNLLTRDGNSTTTPGNNIGSSESFFGTAYLQGAIYSQSTTNALVVLDQLAENGKFIQANYLGNTVGFLAPTIRGIAFQDRNNNQLVDIDGENSSLKVGGSINSSTSFVVQNSSSSSILTVDSTQDQVKVLSGDTDIFEEPYVLHPGHTDIDNVQFKKHADLNGDGFDDIFGNTGFNYEMSVYLSNGDGTYGLPSVYPYSTSSSYSTYFYSADINADAHLDIVIQGGTTDMSILLNNGNGTFNVPVYYVGTVANGYGSGGLAFGDYNNDGNIDIATNWYNMFGIILGNGDGTFSARTSYSLGVTSMRIASDDFNKDNNMDLIFSTATGYSVKLGNGNGTFSTRVDYVAGSNFDEIKTTDLNLDGYSDVLLIENQKTLVVALNGIDGSFATTFRYTYSDYGFYTYNTTIKLGYFNDDRLIDILIQDILLINSGNGTFIASSGARGIDGMGYSGVAEIIPDINNDGFADIASRNLANNFSVFLNSAYIRSTTPGLIVNSAPGRVGQVIVTDPTGTLDALQVRSSVGENLASITANGSLSLGEVQNALNFEPELYTSTSGIAEAVSVDVNNDGWDDVILGNRTNLIVRLNDGSGGLLPEVSYPTNANVTKQALGDISGDGYLDVVGIDTFNFRYITFLNNGNGTFSPAVSYPFSMPNYTIYSVLDLTVGKFDNDNNLDINFILSVGNNFTGQNELHLISPINNGNGTFSNILSNLILNTYSFNPKIIDANNDTVLDVVYLTQSSRQATTMINNGNGLSFTTYSISIPSAGIYAYSLPYFADINTDGNLDLLEYGLSLSGNPRNIIFSVYYGTSSGVYNLTRTELFKYITQDTSNHPLVNVVDLNADTLLDIILPAQGVYVLSNHDSTYTGINKFTKNQEAGIAISANLDNISLHEFIAFPYYGTYRNGMVVYRPKMFGQPTGSIALAGNYFQRNSIDSSDAFGIQNALGQTILNVDTMDGSLEVMSTTNSAKTFEVKNTSASSIFVVDTNANNAILRNQSFENENLTAQGWDAKTGATATYVTSQKYIGVSSVSVVTTATANTGLKYTTGNIAPYALAINSSYNISWYALLDSSSAPFNDIIAAYARDGVNETNCTGINTQTLTSSGWTRFSCTITTNGSAPASSAYIAIKQSSAVARSFYIDAVQVELGTIGTAFREGAISLNGVVVSPVTFRNQSNSTTALQAQNTSGTTIFNIDSLNSTLTVRSATNNTLAFSVLNSTGFAVLSVDTLNSRLEIIGGGDIKFLGSGNIRNAIAKDLTCTATEAVNDIVIITGAGTVGRTTTASSNRVAGVVVAKPTTTTCTVAFSGVVQVNFGANATPTTVGDPIETSATAGMARSTATPTAGAVLGVSLSAKDGSNLVWVLLRSN